MNYRRTYNQVHDIADITTDSETITEPVTLAEMKNFLRLEGFGPDGEPGLQLEEPLALTLLENETTVQSDAIIGKTIVSLAREGTVHTLTTGSPGNRQFAFNSGTGVITFQTAGNAGDETIDIIYGTEAGSSFVSDFEDDDALIEELITAAREGIEKFTGRSLVNHTWKALITNLAGDIELPFSNGATITEVLGCNGGELTTDQYKTIGTEFLMLQTPLQEKITVTYDVVVSSVPKRLKQAIMRDVTYHYENRNDEPGELAIQAQSIASPFKRVSTWLA